MAGWREQKRAALGVIHSAFEIPAVYLTHAAGTPVRVNVRLHNKPIVSPDPFDDNGPAYHDAQTRIVFSKAEVADPLGKAYVIFSATEAYRTGASKPEREGYIHIEVSEVPTADLAELLSDADTSHQAFDGILA